VRAVADKHFTQVREERDAADEAELTQSITSSDLSETQTRAGTEPGICNEAQGVRNPKRSWDSLHLRLAEPDAEVVSKRLQRFLPYTVSPVLTCLYQSAAGEWTSAEDKQRLRPKYARQQIATDQIARNQEVDE
jgi:hypothetical protein